MLSTVCPTVLTENHGHLACIGHQHLLQQSTYLKLLVLVTVNLFGVTGEDGNMPRNSWKMPTT
eukprot:1117640-Pelagomonas_calceolata.AAC.5